MKKISFLLILCFISSFNAIAQNTFAPVGAEWWYGGDNYDYKFYPQGFGGMFNTTWLDHVQSISDTTVDGVNCRKLQVSRKQKNGLGYDSAFVQSSKTLFVYDNTDTVFIFNERVQHFTPLYIFNTPIGDTVKLAVFDTGYVEVDSFEYVLDSVKMETFGTEQLKTYYTHTIDTVKDRLSLNWGGAHYHEPSDQWRNIGRFTKKIGGSWPATGSLLPSYSFHDADGFVFEGFPSGNINCYSEPGFSFKTTTLSCDSTHDPIKKLGVQDTRFSALEISIFPNPASSELHVQSKLPFTSDSWLDIYDMTGRRVITPISLNQHKIISVSVDNWNNGLYYLKFRVGEQAYFQKFQLQH